MIFSSMVMTKRIQNFIKSNWDNRCHKTKILSVTDSFLRFSREQIVFVRLIIRITNVVFHFTLATQGMLIYKGKVLQQINGVVIDSPLGFTMASFSSQTLKLDFFNTL